MILFIVGLVIFFGVHSISIVAPQFRDGVSRRWGDGAWKGLYSVVAAVGLALLIYGFGLARVEDPVVLYTPPVWTRHVTLLLMVPVMPLLFAAYLPGRIKAALKHPMLVAVKLWAFAHLLANGMLVDVLLFGSFLAWAVVDRISLKRRPPQTLRTAAPSRWNDVIAAILGLAMYVWLIAWLHVRIAGVSPLAR